VKSNNALGLVVSDLHFGQKRINETDDSAIRFYSKLAKEYIQKLDAIVEANERVHLFLLGDILEGEGIFPTQAHDALAINQQTELALSFFDDLFDYLGTMSHHIHVYPIKGNHGRVGKYSAEETNWDTVFYKHLELAHTEPAFHNVYNDWHLCVIEDWMFLLMHGDCIPMYFQIPDYGIRTRMMNWVSSIGPFDAFLLGHFHHLKLMHYNGIYCLLNGCARWNDFSVKKMGMAPSTAQWCFGIGPDSPVTWTHAITLENEHLRTPDTGVNQVFRGSTVALEVSTNPNNYYP